MSGLQAVRDALLAANQKATDAARYYLGPAYAPVEGVARLLGAMSPGADMMDMAQSSADLMGADSGMGALQAGLGLGAATLGMAIPGTARGVEEAAETGIRAFHGSPHDFDRFSMDKIGTGEGAQAYGHGLYFAEDEGVAKAYREQLTRNGRGQVSAFRAGGVDVPVADKRAADIADMIQRYDIDLSSADGEEWLSSEIGARGLPSEIRGRINELLAAGVQREDMPGRMYEVRINANPDDFLDWDKPLSEQSEKVRGALAKSETAKRVGDVPGRDFVGHIENRYGPDASLQMRDTLGIPGIKYLDAGSRTAGDGSRNYVVFDDNLIEIMRKYGWLLPTATVGGLLGGQEQEQY